MKTVNVKRESTALDLAVKAIEDGVKVAYWHKGEPVETYKYIDGKLIVNHLISGEEKIFIPRRYKLKIFPFHKKIS